LKRLIEIVMHGCQLRGSEKFEGQLTSPHRISLPQDILVGSRL
jgi:hypothetical protein